LIAHLVGYGSGVQPGRTEACASTKSSGSERVRTTREQRRRIKHIPHHSGLQSASRIYRVIRQHPDTLRRRSGSVVLHPIRAQRHYRIAELTLRRPQLGFEVVNIFAIAALAGIANMILHLIHSIPPPTISVIDGFILSVRLVGRPHLSPFLLQSLKLVP
jgi:hypothetical protein